METQILFCWLGTTDIKSADHDGEGGLGPVAQAVEDGKYREVILLDNWDDPGNAEHYAVWLRRRTSAKVIIKRVYLPSGPTHFGEIYQAASKVVSTTIKQYGQAFKPVFHLSPGTPAMAAIWVLLAKTRFPADLIESSREHGVRPVSIPFDISADFIPELFRNPDKTLEQLAAGLPAKAPEFDDIIHRSDVMQRAILKARRFASRSIPVLIEGESGTGKELLARAIHKASPRKDFTLVTINCGAIPAELVESELFGHKKGAFTGADKDRVGHFEAADKSSIFLDEIGELPKDMQVKLLRTLQEGEIKRIGATKAKKINVRIIAATNRNLINEVATGGFREDLFYRLAVGVINLPPLRERSGDISLLIDIFLEQINRESVKEPGYTHKNISAKARNILLGHSWPGNIRELKNTLTRAAVWSFGEEIDEDDIREALLPIPQTKQSRNQILDLPLENGIDLSEIIKTVAVHYLERGLAQEHGNKTNTARLLGLSSYQTLTNWLKKYGLQ